MGGICFLSSPRSDNCRRRLPPKAPLDASQPSDYGLQKLKNTLERAKVLMRKKGKDQVNFLSSDVTAQAMSNIDTQIEMINKIKENVPFSGLAKIEKTKLQE